MRAINLGSPVHAHGSRAWCPEKFLPRGVGDRNPTLTAALAAARGAVSCYNRHATLLPRRILRWSAVP